MKMEVCFFFLEVYCMLHVNVNATQSADKKEEVIQYSPRVLRKMENQMQISYPDDSSSGIGRHQSSSVVVAKFKDL